MYNENNRYEEPFLGLFLVEEPRGIPRKSVELHGRTAYFQEYSRIPQNSGLHDHYHVVVCEHNDKIPFFHEREVYRGGRMCFPKRYIKPVEDTNTNKAKSVLRKEWDDEN